MKFVAVHSVTLLMLNQSHWMYSYKLNTESESLNVQLQTSYWIRGTECTVTNFILNQSLNVQLQTSSWIRVTECTVTNLILNQSHWMYSYTLNTFVTVYWMSPIQFEVCNCTFSDFDSAWSLLLYIQCLWFSMKFVIVHSVTDSVWSL
jgi:hypothetical protein